METLSAPEVEQTQTLQAQEFTELYSWPAYLQLSKDLFAQGRSTSEEEKFNTPEILEYTKVNLARMERINKTTTLSEEIIQAMASISTPQYWYVISESWCGDAAQNLPILAKIAEVSPMVSFHIGLREKNLPVMDKFLTNGGRAIPKLIATDASGHVLFAWGPRPAAAQELMQQLKAEALPFAEVAQRLHGWYAQNHGQDLMEELLARV